MRAARTTVRRLAAVTALFALCATSTVATVAAAATSPGVGPQPVGQGLGSSAALAQQHCDENGRMTFNALGLGPFCVNPWPAGKDNGGATAPGVTADSVKVIAYIPDESMPTGSTGPVNQATGAEAAIPDVIRDWKAVYDHAVKAYGTYQMWGRHIDLQVVTATGADEASQRADAVRVISQKPFLVFDATDTSGGGAPAFSTAVAARKIIVASASTTKESAQRQSPYRWQYGADPDAGSPLTAAFVGRTLGGNKARYAGDALKSQTRRFGVVYPSTGFDIADFEARVKQNGATIAQAVGFDTATITDQVQTIVGKLKDAGVTSVVAFADPTAMEPLTKAATAQGYFPEWITTGYGYQEYDLFAQQYDPQQMQHAFGLSVLFPAVPTTGVPAYLDSFDWYWGADQGNTWSIAPGIFGFIYGAIHYAGPTLTAENVRKGLFSVPAQGGAATDTIVYQQGYGNTVGMPYPEYASLGSDRAFTWFDPTKTGVAQAAGIKVSNGLFLYLDGGKRYGYEDMPDKEPRFFDSANGVSEAPLTAQYPGGVIPTAAPCTGCPSSTGTSSNGGSQ